MVKAGHLTPDAAYRLTVRELALYSDDGGGGGQAQGPEAGGQNPLAGIQAAAIADERRWLLGRLTVAQKAELARWKARLCR